MKSLSDKTRGLARLAYAGGEIDEAGDDACLIADLMQMTEAAADRGLIDLANKRQHRRIHSVGGEKRSRGIEQARPGHHGIDLRLAGGERSAKRHIRRALLMARMDGANALSCLEQRVKQM